MPGTKRGECARPNCDKGLWARDLCKEHYFNAVNRGFLPPSGYRDAKVSRQRVKYLMDRGLTRCELSRLTGVNLWTVRKLVDGKTDTVRAMTEARLLEFEIPTRTKGRINNPIGSVRRLQALVMMGYSQRDLMSRLGLLDESNFSEIVLGKRRYLYAGLANKIAALFDELQSVPGPSDRARRRARQNGWAAPFSWDDGEIDDPDARPHMVPRHWGDDGWSQRYEEYQSIGMSVREMANMEGISTHAIYKRIERAA